MKKLLTTNWLTAGMAHHQSATDIAGRGSHAESHAFGLARTELLVATAVTSAILVAVQGIPVAVYNPFFSIALAVTASLVGLALLHLGIVRFSFFGYSRDLYAGLAFGTLALSNLIFGVIIPVAPQADLLPAEGNLGMALLKRTVAAALFIASLYAGDTVVNARIRRRTAARISACVASAVSFGIVAVLTTQGSFPRAVDAHLEDIDASGALFFGIMPPQDPRVVLANSAIAVLLLIATVGYVRLYRQHRDPHTGILATALVLLLGSQFHIVLVPLASTDFVSISDGFRLSAYLVLLFSLVSRLGREVEEQATHDERLRLSRELHDGLAQQLGLLNLRLSRAASAERPEAERTRDLDAARRLVEAALLEARQAITSLRTGNVSWEDLARTLSSFADEFAQNHQVEVRLSALENETTSIRADLQAELLRILHEAFSNAIRHGCATQINVSLNCQSGWLTLEIRDNGQGFHAPLASERTGIGLHSMRERLERRGGSLSIETSPGQGVVARARVPRVGIEMGLT